MLDNNELTIRQIYLKLLGTRPHVDWKYLIIANNARPRAIFAMRMQLQDKLATIDRLTSWDMTVDTKCKLCRVELENRDHLFVFCEFTKTLWKRLLNWINKTIHIATTWEHHLTWAVANAREKSQNAQLFRILYAEYTYALWEERNQRTFENRSRQWDQIAKEIALMCNMRAPLGPRTKLQHPLF
ncbi:uncharacterized protein LOC132614883 [Lycium barbarum]|uniref:uncharacterized protein LOC132614883 n=1 Tax=Lycium barbarum TaxID=112863 RepID=UPI00293F246C|nr:uncharacterized protein LOC132614883 [Lycium barbarum]